MASFLGLVESSSDILVEIFAKSQDAEELRREEHHHAVVIQAWYRACRSRQYLNELHQKATEIQRTWRGYAARKKWRQLIARLIDQLKSDFYNRMATQIQRTWRGFFSRKYTHYYYALQRYLTRVKVRNEEMRVASVEERERGDARRLAEQEAEAHRRLVADSKSKHHLLSTFHIPGVYNNPKHPGPEETEYRLKAVTPLMATEQRRSATAARRDRRKCDQKEMKLPPLPPQPQGPFKEQKKVYIQRHKPHSPSLRVATSYFTQQRAREAMVAEEWVNRVYDDKFKHVGVIDRPYRALMHTSSPYKPLGALELRQAKKEKWMGEKDFKSLVPRVPYFDKYNKAYDEFCHHCTY